MKKLMVLAIALVSAIALNAQNQVLSNDPAVKTGKLDNGMTYYIRHNDLPAGRCEFYLATNVGAIQETPDQDGLAHFLEHMCFNGLKNFPGKQMLEYLQHIGAEFGRNINASTGVEHTQYMLNNMPVTREGILDTCLLVMHDYSHFVLNEPEEIDAERGVILEEKRTRNNAAWRMMEKSYPYMYGASSKYAGCTVIGSAENLKTFKPESLWNFYKTWYQPDMQALIIVGDIDVDQVYNKVVKLFSDIPAPSKATIKTMPSVVFNTEPVAAILTDPENTSTSVNVIWKIGIPRAKEDNGTVVGYYNDLVKQIISNVLNERLSDISSKADSPFLNGYLQIGDICETCEVLYGMVSCENGKAIAATRALMTEVERAIRYGFTDDEIDRVRTNIIKGLKDKMDGAATRKNPEFIYPIINNFFSGYPYMEPALELQLAATILSQMNSQIVNEEISEYLVDNPPTFIYQGVDKPGETHPSEGEFIALVDEVYNSDIEKPQVQEISSDFMNGAVPAAVAAKKESKGDYNSTVWEFTNGLKVVVLPTEYKKDQVLITVRRQGGTSNIPTADLASFDRTIARTYVGNQGISTFPKTTVDKMLTGKTVYLNPAISEIFNGVQGSCNPDDIETALQIVNLMYTAPRFDAEEWNIGINQLNAFLPNMVGTPDYALNDHIFKAIYNNPRCTMISAKTLQNASLENYAKYYNAMFSGVSGATMYIVGNVNIETLKPLVETYCGSLPAGSKASYNKKNIVLPVKGKNTDEFAIKMETPKTSVFQLYSANVKYSVQKEVNFDAAGFILNMIYTETLREQEGGTYGASAVFDLSYVPTEQVLLQVYFDTNVEQQARLRELALEGVMTLAKQGPTDEQLTRAIENAKKNLPEKRITNSYWMSCMKYNELRGGNYDAEYEAAIGNITASGVKAAVAELLKSGNFSEIVMKPAE